MRRQLKPFSVRPRDFLAFWQKTRAELDGVPIRLDRAPAPAPDGLLLEDISFESLAGVRIHGYFLHAAGNGRGPLVVHAHGYGSCCTVQWDWGRAGFNVVGIDVRGYGGSAAALPEPSKWGYVLTGSGAPETSVLRGAVCDFVRAIDIGRSLLAPDCRSIVPYGRSFGGALALMAEATSQVASFLAIGVPSLGWAEGRHFFVKQGSGQEINSYLQAYPDHMEDLMLVLRYFDATYFAELVRCPTLLGIGLEDVVVPAKTVYAIANHLGGPVEIMEFPVSHTDRPEEKLWDAFEARWEALAKQVLPDSFGQAASG